MIARRERSLVWQLGRLSLGLLLPTLVFVGILLWRFSLSERNRVEEEARGLSRGFAVALDREINGVLTTLQALATSPSLQTGDFVGFYAQAKEVSRLQGLNISLRDTAGRALLTTRLPYGASPAVPAVLVQIDQEVLKTGKATVSNIFTSSISANPVFQIVNAPIRVSGKPAYMLSASIDVGYLSEAIRREHLPEGWIGAILDRNGVFVARTARFGQFAGKEASPDYRAHAVDDGGSYYGRNSDGSEVLVGYAKSSLTGWTAGANLAREAVDAPLRRSLLALAGLGLGLGLVAILFAFLTGRRLTRAFNRLAEMAADVGRGRPVVLADTGIAEINRVSVVLRGAAEQRDVAEAALHHLTDTLEAQVVQRTRERNRLWETTNDLVGTTGFDGRLLSVNPAWTTVLGWTEAELVARPLHDLVDLADHAALADVVAKIVAGETVTGHVNHVLRKSGTPRTIAWNAMPVPDESMFYLVGRDLTAQRHAEEALRQSQKMEAVGQLTGGIAHDFNNMLAVIIGGLSLVQRRLARGDTGVEHYVERAMEGATRAATLTQRLLAFSRRQPLKPEPIVVNDLVAGLSEMLRRTIGERIQLESVLAGGLWMTRADPGELENALLNLVVNARDAMVDGGKLTIETANTYLDEPYAREHDVKSGQYVLVAVTDTGTGMAPEVVARAFEPFFTTKPVGKGTGLGLSQIYGFVKQSAGHVQIYSEPGHGTTFKIYLPRLFGIRPAATLKNRRHTPAVSISGRPNEIILVVEDDDRVRTVSVDALRDLGFTVIHASGGQNALELLRTHPDVSLLFTDVVMPGMNGRELADTVAAERPTLKVLFATGYTHNAIVHNGALDPGVQLITKPFSVEQLALKVRAVLDER